MTAHLNSPIFQDPEAAREWLEARIWPNGPFCPHCGSISVTEMHGKAHRPGLFQCNDCREQFTVTVGSVAERSKIPLNKWVLAIYLIQAVAMGLLGAAFGTLLGIGLQLGLPRVLADFLPVDVRVSLDWRTIGLGLGRCGSSRARMKGARGAVARSPRGSHPTRRSRA